MAADRKIEHLSKVKMFSSLNKKELNLIASADVVKSRRRRHRQGGTTGHEFYLILEGTAVSAERTQGGHPRR